MEIDVDFLDFWRVNAANEQISEVSYYLSVYPYLNFTVLLTYRVQLGHHLVRVPASALWKEVCLLYVMRIL